MSESAFFLFFNLQTRHEWMEQNFSIHSCQILSLNLKTFPPAPPWLRPWALIIKIKVKTLFLPALSFQQSSCPFYFSLMFHFASFLFDAISFVARRGEGGRVIFYSQYIFETFQQIFGIVFFFIFKKYVCIMNSHLLLVRKQDSWTNDLFL